jgi:hypothetical protein
MKRRKGFGIVSSDQIDEQPTKKKETRKRSRKRKLPTSAEQHHSDDILRNSESSDMPPTYIKFTSIKKDLPPDEHKNIIVWDEWGFDIEKSDIVRQHILDDVQSKRQPRTRYWAKLEK